mmetsp:Transcript_1295/g.2804  ORF Transcript_1295/g.2804 Transcript_1295/m.2804 type:complete len:278 (+) Transcript_1295:427-1260(+)
MPVPDVLSFPKMARYFASSSSPADQAAAEEDGEAAGGVAGVASATTQATGGEAAAGSGALAATGSGRGAVSITSSSSPGSEVGSSSPCRRRPIKAIAQANSPSQSWPSLSTSASSKMAFNSRMGSPDDSKISRQWNALRIAGCSFSASTFWKKMSRYRSSSAGVGGDSTICVAAALWSPEQQEALAAAGVGAAMGAGGGGAATLTVCGVSSACGGDAFATVAGARGAALPPLDGGGATDEFSTISSNAQSAGSLPSRLAMVNSTLLMSSRGNAPGMG